MVLFLTGEDDFARDDRRSLVRLGYTLDTYQGASIAALANVAGCPCSGDSFSQLPYCAAVAINATYTYCSPRGASWRDPVAAQPLLAIRLRLFSITLSGGNGYFALGGRMGHCSLVASYGVGCRLPRGFLKLFPQDYVGNPMVLKFVFEIDDFCRVLTASYMLDVSDGG
jgi:hypothetical protein